MLQRSPLLSNFFSLAFVQGTNYLLPLLVFPYLVRILGVDTFGQVAFAQSLMLYFTVIAEYAFNLSATRQVATQRDKPKALQKIFNTVFTCRLLLCLACLLLLAALLELLPLLSGQHWLFYLSFVMVPGQVLLPGWFLQGMEKMAFLAYLNLAAKAIATLLIFVLIRRPEDYLYVNLLLGSANLLSAIAATALLWKYFSLRPGLAPLRECMRYLREGLGLFVSNFLIAVSVNVNLPLLGLMAGAGYLPPGAVGYYSIAEKIFLAIRSLAGIAYQAIYPRVCLLVQRRHEDAAAATAALRSFLKKIFVLLLLFFLAVGVATFVFAGELVALLAGRVIPETVQLVQILSFAPLMAAINIPACQLLLASQLNRPYALIASTGALLNLALCVSLGYLWSGSGVAFSALLTETMVTGLLYVYVLRQKRLYSTSTSIS